MDANDIFIKTTDLKKIYKVGNDRVAALGGVDIEVPRGKVCAILGTSGSGKSTLLNMLAGLEKPTAGQIKIGRYSIEKMNENQLAKFRQFHTGFVFQSYNLIPSMNAVENVAMPLMFKGVPRKEREAKALEMLKKVGLYDRANHRPNEMSGGQQQRVGIARAFVASPKIIFADEPTGNLDSHTTESVMTLITNIVRENGQTMILVTHDSHVASFADMTVNIVDGLVVS